MARSQDRSPDAFLRPFTEFAEFLAADRVSIPLRARRATGTTRSGVVAASWIWRSRGLELDLPGLVNSEEVTRAVWAWGSLRRIPAPTARGRRSTLRRPGEAQASTELERLEALDGPAAILLEILPHTDEVPNGFLLQGGDSDCGELARSVQAGQVASVQPIGLDGDPGRPGMSEGRPTVPRGGRSYTPRRPGRSRVTPSPWRPSP